MGDLLGADGRQLCVGSGSIMMSPGGGTLTTAFSVVAVGTAANETGFENPGTLTVTHPAGTGHFFIVIGWSNTQSPLISMNTGGAAGGTQIGNIDDDIHPPVGIWRIPAGDAGADVELGYTGANTDRSGISILVTGDAVPDIDANIAVKAGTGDRPAYTGTLPTIDADDGIIYGFVSNNDSGAGAVPTGPPGDTTHFSETDPPTMIRSAAVSAAPSPIPDWTGCAEDTADETTCFAVVVQGS